MPKVRWIRTLSASLDRGPFAPAAHPGRVQSLLPFDLVLSNPVVLARVEMRQARCISSTCRLLRSKPRLVDKPRLFQFRSGCLLFAGRARRVPLRRFLVVEPPRF
jgi:hypothetical protein